jgi:hypothetical protein
LLTSNQIGSDSETEAESSGAAARWRESESGQRWTVVHWCGDSPARETESGGDREREIEREVKRP